MDFRAFVLDVMKRIKRSLHTGFFSLSKDKYKILFLLFFNFHFLFGLSNGLSLYFSSVTNLFHMH